MNTRHAIVGCVLTAALAAIATVARGQLPQPNQAGVSTGHTHLAVPDVAKHAEIWKLLGAEEIAAGRLRVFALPGMLILLTERAPGAPSAQTSANHIGFTVRDYAAYRAKLQAADASFFFENEDEGQLLADLPDGVRIELLTDPEQEAPIAFHHLHLAAPDPAALQQWYLQAFGAEAGERRGLPSALVPGGRVDFLPARGETPLPSRGNAIDHIGFEVSDLAAFAERLTAQGVEFDMAPTEIEAIGLTIAFITDPAGTYIELTEGLRALR